MPQNLGILRLDGPRLLHSERLVNFCVISDTSGHLTTLHHFEPPTNSNLLPPWISHHFILPTTSNFPPLWTSYYFEPPTTSNFLPLWISYYFKRQTSYCFKPPTTSNLLPLWTFYRFEPPHCIPNTRKSKSILILSFKLLYVAVVWK